MARDGAALVIGGFVAAVIAGFAIWYFVIRGEDDADLEQGFAGNPAAEGEPQIVSEDELAVVPDEVDRDVYWAGPQPGTELELTVTDDESVYLRYLEDDAEAGTKKPVYLTVGSYPVEDAYDVLEEYSTQPGSSAEDAANGGLAVVNESAPSSVYLAYPGSDVQIEVFDPDPERALELATSSEIEPIE